MNCANCGTENRPDRRFCRNCGLPLASACAVCGAANEAGDRFCGNCGSALASIEPAGEPATSAQAPGSAPVATTERRFVSVLFLDLVGFTALTEARDPEEVQALQRRYFQAAREVIGRYGGTVEKFIGDAVMAVWGTPVAHEDDADRAVRAALDLVDSVAQLDTGAPELRLQARAAVMTGEAAVNLAAAGQGMVTGDLVNTAARLQGAAESGWVLVGDATRRATEVVIGYESIGEQQLKGKGEGVAAWRAVAVLAGRGAVGRADVLEPPFVGRDTEFHMLKELLHATGRERRARLVSIVGIAGIGKSRLVWELEKYIDGIEDAIYWHQGRSPAYGEGVAFWALGEMVRQRAGIAETDEPAVARERLDASLAEYVPDAEERDWLGPRLAALIGLEEMPVTERADLFAAWRTFFERVSERGTAVLVFEDLQWADQGLFDFVESLLEWSRSHPLLIVTLARPEVFERRPSWGAGQRNFSALHLEPLPDGAIHELLAGLSPGIPEALIARVVARAEGVPLYAVETVRMLIGEGRLVLRSAGGIEVVGDIATLEVPDTLRGLIAARLDSLDGGDRALVQDAAVLGLVFTSEGLSAIHGAPKVVIKERLAGLVRREIMRLDADPRSPERGQYGFVQGLLQEVAYGTLAKPERRARHLAAVRFFEAVGSDEIAAIVADHYLRAFQATPPGPEANALAAQARLALRAAGERAAALHSHVQALAFLERALEVTLEPLEQAQLHERAGDVARAGVVYDAALLHLRAAAETYRSLGDRSALARAVAALGRVMNNHFQVEEARVVLEAGVTEVGELGDDPGAAALLAELARVYMFDADGVRGLPAVDRALAIAERLELIDVTADAMTTKGNLLTDFGRLHESIALQRGAATLAAAHGFSAIQLRALNNLAGRLWGEDPRESWSTGLESVEVARRLGEAEWLLAAAQWAGGIGVSNGRWPEAIALLDEFDRPDLPAADHVAFASPRMIIHALRGEADVAARIEREITPLRATFGRTEDLAWPHVDRSNLEYCRGEFSKAIASAFEGAAAAKTGEFLSASTAANAAFAARDAAAARRAVEIVDASPDRGRYIQALREYVRGGSRLLDGDVESGLRDLREAARYMRLCDARVDLTFALLAIVQLAPDDHPARHEAAAEARAIIDDLGARALGAILDRASPPGAASQTAAASVAAETPSAAPAR